MNDKLVLFDFDGTLIDSIPLSYAAIHGIFQKLNLEPPPFEAYIDEYSPPFMGFWQRRGVTVPEETLWKWYHEVSDHLHASMFGDVFVNLAKLSCRGASLGVVSGQVGSVITKHLAENGIQYLFKTVFSNITDKAEAIRTFCQVFGHFGADTFFLTFPPGS